jgi:hypothetical protein
MNRKHWADRPILRDFFWFLVLPYRFKQWLADRKPSRHD